MENCNKLKRSRQHYVLFHKDSPFRQKVVELKTRYRRRDKHPQRSQQTDI